MNSQVITDFFNRLNAIRPFVPPMQFDALADHPTAHALVKLASGELLLTAPKPPEPKPEEPTAVEVREKPKPASKP